MVKCKICGKSFRNKRALGGHVGNVHAEANKEVMSVLSKDTSAQEVSDAHNVVSVEIAEAVAEDRDKAERIRELINDGYSLEQIVKRFGFNYKTAWQVMKEQVVPENRPEAKELELLPAKIDDKRQQIVPEYLFKMLVSLDGGRALTPLETILLFQAARRTVMEDINMYQGLTEAQAKATETQLKVFREAKSEANEVAQKAAEETAARVAAYFEQKKPDVASTSSPLEEVFARFLQTTMTNLVNKLLPGAAGETPLGFVTEKRRRGE